MYHISPEIQKFLNAVPFGKNPITQYSFVGPRGCGKTELAALIHERLGYGPGTYMRFVCNKDTKIKDLTLDYTAKDGSIVEVMKEFLSLMQKPSVIVLDELPLAPADVAAGLNAILDNDRAWTAPDGRVFKRHEKCHIILTSNPASYAGVKRQHGGFVDRFPTLAMGYSPDEKDIILEAHPGIGDSMAARLCKLAELLRNAQAKTGIEADLSTRGLLMVGQMIENGAEPVDAVKFTVKVSEDDEEAVNQLLRLALGAVVTVDKKTGKSEVDILAGMKEETARHKEEMKQKDERIKEMEDRIRKFTDILQKSAEIAAKAKKA